MITVTKYIEKKENVEDTLTAVEALSGTLACFSRSSSTAFYLDMVEVSVKTKT